MFHQFFEGRVFIPQPDPFRIPDELPILASALILLKDLERGDGCFTVPFSLKSFRRSENAIWPVSHKTSASRTSARLAAALRKAAILAPISPLCSSTMALLLTVSGFAFFALYEDK